VRHVEKAGTAQDGSQLFSRQGIRSPHDPNHPQVPCHWSLLLFSSQEQRKSTQSHPQEGLSSIRTLYQHNEKTEGFENWRPQFVTFSRDMMSLRYRPMAFTKKDNEVSTLKRPFVRKK
jgi:hypothetical protein